MAEPQQDSIRTRVTDLFGVRYPIVQGGMIWVAGWKLARAVSEAGGLGVIGAGSMTPELLELHLDRIAAAGPVRFGVNIPVFHRHAAEQVGICLRRGVRIVLTSGGSPARFTGRLKDRGTTVVHVVPSAALARKVEEAGCDAVVAEGTEAGGHNGFEEVTSMCLWPDVARTVRIPTIAAGGVACGRGLAAALALGADGVQVGSRFAATFESSASEGYKQAVVRAGEADAKLYLRRLGPTRALANAYVRRAMEAEARGADREELAAILGHGRSRRGIFEGDEAEGELEVGQVAGRIDEILPAAEVVRRMVREFRAAVDALAGADQ